MSPSVAIVIPVYNAFEDTCACVESVVAGAEGDCRIFLVDDASTDPRIPPFLENMSGRDSRILVIRLEQNRGFVRAANTGMKAASGRDILLLNSDTIVPRGFIQRLQACAYADEKTGIVSPFSNNATICSVPVFRVQNPMPEMPLDQYSKIIANSSLRRRPVIPTAVGFCMYIRAAVIESVGFFDEAFGRGFGEENDFCEKAKDAGFEVRLCDDLFVAHTGKASFGEEGWKLSETNAALLLERHPGYEDLVEDFCARNPLRELQENVRYHTERHPGLMHPSVLFLIHGDPFSERAGGTEMALVDLVRSLRLPRALVAHTRDASLLVDEIMDGRTEKPFRHRYDIGTPVPDCALIHEAVCRVMEDVLDNFNVLFVHVHHLFNWPLSIWRIFEKKQIPFFFTVHDYMCICPNINLFDYRTGTSCACRSDPGEVEECLKACEKAVGRKLPATSLSFLDSYREEFARMFEAARKITAPSKRALEIASAGYETLKEKGICIPIGLAAFPIMRRAPGSGPLRVGVLGDVSHQLKGEANYRAAVAATVHDNIEWHFFGPTAASGLEERLLCAGSRKKICFHGPYRRSDIHLHLADAAVDIVALLPACEETFSLTLSEALLAGVPVVGLRHGAIAERLSESGLEDLLVSSVEKGVEKLREIAAHREKAERLKDRISSLKMFSLEDSAAAFSSFYGDLLYPLFRPDSEYDYEKQRINFRGYWDARKNAFSDPATRMIECIPLRRYLGGISSGLCGLLPPFLTRKLLLPLSFSYIQRFDPATSTGDVRFSPDMPRRSRFLKRGFCSIGIDPFVVLPPYAIETEIVDIIRLRFAAECEGKFRTQLYWMHRGDPDFSEAKSLIINPPAQKGMNDLILDLRQWEGNERWYSGAVVERLRFDPIDRNGSIYLGEVSLLRRTVRERRPIWRKK